MTTETEWVLVPRVATDDMLDAGHDVLCERHKTGSFGECPRHSWGDSEACYTAMLSAAPPPRPRVVTDGDLDRALEAHVAELRDGSAWSAMRAALESFSASGEVSDVRVPILWRVETPYGVGYALSDEFLAAFPDFPIPPPPAKEST